MARH
jgi:hypothetical protein